MSKRSDFIDKRPKGYNKQWAEKRYDKMYPERAAQSKADSQRAYDERRMKRDNSQDGINIDRSSNSPWQDFAHTSDDI